MVRLADFHPLPEGSRQFSIHYIESRKVLRLGEREGKVLVGIVDPDDILVQEELRHHFQVPLEFCQVPATELSEYLSGLVSATNELDTVSGPEKMRLDQLANDAPIVNLTNSLLMEGLRRGCSDIHIESLPHQARVRYRIDGVMQNGRHLSRDTMPGLSSRIKIMANLDIIERRLPQDGRLSVVSGGQTIEFRVSIVPLADGESIVLRVFQKEGGIPSLESLGFSQNYQETLRRAAGASHGLILVTGPTGSGKTTTLNSLMVEISSPLNKVITIEDPVENVLEGVNRIQTNEAIGLGFDTLLRRLLRQDPDILMVGEIRDRTTADLTVRAAMTGHLVLSTLHTNDALSAIIRLRDLGVEAFLLGSVLRAVAAQRLVRTLCPHCAVKVPLTPVEQTRFGAPDFTLPYSYTSVGCEQCSGTGYAGRSAVAEIFYIDAEVEEMILGGATRPLLEEYFQSKRNPFLWDDCRRLLSEGRTSIAEIDRAVFSR